MRYDVEYFARRYFPALCRLPFSDMHRELFARRAARLADCIVEREPERMALAAPRGSAKSTVLSLLFVIHDILYAQEPYIALFSATLAQSTQKLRNIRRELESNAALRHDYAKELDRIDDRSVRRLGLNGVRVEAWSAGSEVRGALFGEWRPTRIVLDDVEDSDLVESAESRERLHDWFREVIERLGDKYTRIHVAGTVLHPDSLLARLLERPDFDALRYAAVRRFADRADLWETWRGKFADLANPNRSVSARAFFRKRQAEMLAGADVLWPEKEGYYTLMAQLAAQGRRAFFKEMQNEPLRADSAVFDPSTFRMFHRDGPRIVLDGGVEGPNLDELRIVGFLDSAMGKSSSRSAQGDFAAIATVGADAQGRLFVLSVWLDRATPSEQARRVFAEHDLWSYSEFGIESNGFQGLVAEPIETVRQARRAKGRKHDLAIRPVLPRGSKVERVAALEPLVANGWLLFDRALPAEFFAQMESFPNGRHDDGPDALASAVALAREGPARVEPLNRPRAGSRLKGF